MDVCTSNSANRARNLSAKSSPSLPAPFTGALMYERQRKTWKCTMQALVAGSLTSHPNTCRETHALPSRSCGKKGGKEKTFRCSSLVGFVRPFLNPVRGTRAHSKARFKSLSCLGASRTSKRGGAKVPGNVVPLFKFDDPGGNTNELLW